MKRSTIYKICPPLGLALGALYFLTGSPLATVGLTGVGLAAFVTAVGALNRDDLLLILMWGFFVLCIAFEAVKNTSFGATDNILLLSAHIGLAAAVRRQRPSKKVALGIYGVVLGLLVVHLAGGGLADDFLPEKSRNHVSVLFLFLTTYVLVAVGPKDRWGTVVCTATVAVAVAAIGRSGIIASIILLGGVGLTQWSFKNVGRVVLVSLLLIGAYLLASKMQLIPEKALAFEKFSNRMAIDPRAEIIRTYFSQLSFSTVLTGFYTHELSKVAGFLTLHNSYLALHFRFGIMGVLFILLMVGLVVRGGFSRLDSVRLYAVVLLALMVRGFTDVIFLPNGTFDFLVFYFLAVLFNDRKSGGRNRQLARASHMPLPDSTVRA